MSVCIYVLYNILLEVLLNTIHNVDAEKDSSNFSLFIHKTNDEAESLTPLIRQSPPPLIQTVSARQDVWTHPNPNGKGEIMVI